MRGANSTRRCFFKVCNSMKYKKSFPFENHKNHAKFVDKTEVVSGGTSARLCLPYYDRLCEKRKLLSNIRPSLSVRGFRVKLFLRAYDQYSLNCRSTRAVEEYLLFYVPSQQCKEYKNNDTHETITLTRKNTTTLKCL